MRVGISRSFLAPEWEIRRNLLQSLEEQRCCLQLTDITFEFSNGQTLWAHASWLARCSQLVQELVKESNCGCASSLCPHQPVRLHFLVPGYSRDLVKSLLDLIYIGEVNVTKTDLDGLKCLAMDLQMTATILEGFPRTVELTTDPPPRMPHACGKCTARFIHEGSLARHVQRCPERPQSLWSGNLAITNESEAPEDDDQTNEADAMSSVSGGSILVGRSSKSAEPSSKVVICHVCHKTSGQNVFQAHLVLHFKTELAQLNGAPFDRSCSICKFKFSTPTGTLRHFALVHQKLKVIVSQDQQPELYLPVYREKSLRRPGGLRRLSCNNSTIGSANPIPTTVISPSTAVRRNPCREFESPSVGQLVGASDDEESECARTTSSNGSRRVASKAFQCHLCSTWQPNATRLRIHCTIHFKNEIMKMYPNSITTCELCGYAPRGHFNVMISHLGNTHRALESLIEPKLFTQLFRAPKRREKRQKPVDQKQVDRRQTLTSDPPSARMQVLKNLWKDLNHEHGLACLICHRTVSKAERRRHIVGHFVDDFLSGSSCYDGGKSCSKCHVVLSSRFSLAYHVGVVHKELDRLVDREDEEFPCPMCDASEKTKGQLKLHLCFTHFPKQLAALLTPEQTHCPFCDTPYPSTTKLEHHLIDTHVTWKALLIGQFELKHVHGQSCSSNAQE